MEDNLKLIENKKWYENQTSTENCIPVLMAYVAQNLAIMDKIVCGNQLPKISNKKNEKNHVVLPVSHAQGRIVTPQANRETNDDQRRPR